MGDAGYAKSREFGDSFMLEVKSLLGQVLFIETSAIDDMKHNADLTVELNGRKSIEIAVRIRGHRYLIKNNGAYKNQFTLCCHRDSGYDAEWQKITGIRKTGGKIELLDETWGDYIFYGFENATGDHLERWFIGQFDYFRSHVSELRRGKDNKDHICFNGSAEQIGEILHVPRINEYTGEQYFDIFYAFERDAFPGFVIADSDNWPKPS